MPTQTKDGKTLQVLGNIGTPAEAVQVAEESEFLRRVLPEGLSKRYFSEELKRCAALRSAPDRAEHERVYYFNAI